MYTKKNKLAEKFMLELPVYDSIGQAAAHTGIPASAFSDASKKGCRAIRNSRVYLGEWLKWVFNKSAVDGEDAIDWTTRDKRAAALIKEFALQKSRDESIDFALVTTFVHQLVNQTFFGELERLANEWPANLKGLDENAIHAQVLSEIEKVKLNLDSQLTAWKENKGK